MHLGGLAMALIKYKLGELIEQCDERNIDGKYIVDDVKGISTGKLFIETKANLDGVSLVSYKVVKNNEFAYVADTSRRGDKIALAYNDDKEILISSIYTVFRVQKPDLLLSTYLYMYFNRPEFDRFSRFNSWGSARETFDWADFCDIDIELPSKDIQEKYVDVYNALLANQQSYERGLENLKLVCDAFIEDLRRKTPSERIGPYIFLSSLKAKDSNKSYSTDDILGVSSVYKKFIETKANTDGLSVDNYNVVQERYFSFNPNTARMGDKLPIALNDTGKEVLVSAIYPVFGCLEEKLIPEYLAMFFSREEFDRYVRYHSWGSARETFDWVDMVEVKIPIPKIEIQKDIANIYNSMDERKRINNNLKSQIKDICSILIKGSIEEAKKSKEA